MPGDEGTGESQQQQENQQQGGPLGRGEGGADQQQQQQTQLPEWMGGLPDDLKADATLARFKSIEELGRGHIEAHKLAKSKVVLPKDGDADSFARFAAATRPETAEAYKFDIPEGQDSSLAEAMRPSFFKAGMHPEAVKIIVDDWNAHMGQLSQAAEQKGRDEIDGLKAEMGAAEFAKGQQAAVNMLNRLGIPSDFENDLARFHGGGNTLRLLFDMAARMGELGRVDPTDIKISTGALTPQEAMNEARALQKTAGAKLEDPNSPERKRYNELLRISGG